MLQSIEEHQKIPKKETAVMPGGGPRKRRRVCNLTTELRQRARERTRENNGSRRKSAATCKKVSRRAKLTWRKRNLIREFGPKETGDRGRNWSSHAK
jgi:hypothetical protein